MSTRTKRPRATVPVKFADEEADDNEHAIMRGPVEDDDADNMTDMISIIQQFQEKKSAKSSSRSAVFQRKKDAAVSQAREQVEKMTHEGTAYIEQCKARIDELQRQEASSDEMLKDIVQLWGAHENSVHALLALYPSLIKDLSPRRAKDINSASETLETHPLARESSRRRLMRTAKKNIEMGLENQKIATDASALIKHYKALLLS